jgi:hypothetical protein
VIAKFLAICGGWATVLLMNGSKDLNTLKKPTIRAKPLTETDSQTIERCDNNGLIICLEKQNSNLLVLKKRGKT